MPHDEHPSPSPLSDAEIERIADRIAAAMAGLDGDSPAVGILARRHELAAADEARVIAVLEARQRPTQS